MGLKTHHPGDSPLKVLTYGNDLMSYVLRVTQNSPKQYRFTFITRLQNLTMDVVELMLLANNIYVTKANIPTTADKRLSYQHQALSKLQALNYFSMEAQKYQAITFKHATQINKQGIICIQYLQAWIKSDRSRYQKIYASLS